jgi:hypothetical protein
MFDWTIPLLTWLVDETVKLFSAIMSTLSLNRVATIAPVLWDRLEVVLKLLPKGFIHGLMIESLCLGISEIDTYVCKIFLSSYVPLMDMPKNLSFVPLGWVLQMILCSILHAVTSFPLVLPGTSLFLPMLPGLTAFVASTVDGVQVGTVCGIHTQCCRFVQGGGS